MLPTATLQHTDQNVEQQDNKTAIEYNHLNPGITVASYMLDKPTSTQRNDLEIKAEIVCSMMIIKKNAKSLLLFDTMHGGKI